MDIGQRELRSRRSLLKGAGAVTIGAVALPLARLLPATAQTATQELTDEDIAAFAESVELAAVAAYAAALAAGGLSPSVVTAATAFQAHHREHAAAFATAAGSAAESKPNGRLLEVVTDQLRNATSERSTLQVLLDLENAAAGTYLYALGALTSASALKLAASVLPVESQHAVVIGQAIGKAVGDLVPALESQSRGLTPEKFPTVPTTPTTTSTTTK